ncbi:hypothetical protein DFS33DRAFT_1456844 [Desarmillaria ectypa]|nr:hypothetical protein DFS33DRAFT_1456844 [Desarmillaria ectypa]
MDERIQKQVESTFNDNLIVVAPLGVYLSRAGAAQSTDTAPSKDYIIATYGKTTVFVRRSDVTHYQELVALLLHHFPNTGANSIIVQTKEMDICAGRDVDIPSHLWREISPQIQNIAVVSPQVSPGSTQKQRIAPQLMTIFVQIPTGETISVALAYPASTPKGIPSGDQFLTYEGQFLDWDYRLSEYNIPDWATIHLKLENYETLGKKPVIYLFSSLQIHATVRVPLIKAWLFSAVYPGVRMKDAEFGQSITWNVKTHDDHTITDITNGTQVSYLFWEAKTNSLSPPSPPASPRMLPNGVHPFNPSLRQITNDNSVVLHTPKVAAYLDKALTALDLHIEARTSFITFWLPSIQKHDYVALHFLPQSSYQYAAPLEIDPEQDVVIRIFMLFKRVCKDDLEDWEGALSWASEHVEFWQSVVSMDCDGMKDEKLFRVLEWGGIEVNR